MGFDVETVRADFPILGTEVQGNPLVYLDNGATTQKPRCVIDAVTRFYEKENANIHRGVHYLSVQATDLYDLARGRVAAAIGAAEEGEVVFVRGTTEAVNLVARSFLQPRLGEGDEILVTAMEHHANIVPWQLVAEACGAKIVVVPVTDRGEIDLEVFAGLLGERTRMVGVTHVSNVLGTVNPVREIVRLVREKTAGAAVLVDGAQAVAHGRVDVGDLGADFYAFSGHKVYGPDGVGVLWGRAEILAEMGPYQGGGDMIERVSFAGTTFKRPPERFEAGTPNISGAIGLAEAFGYLEGIGWEEMAGQERVLLEVAEAGLREIPGVVIHGGAVGKASVVSFSLEGVHPHDIGTVLDSGGVAIRAGNHCAQPLMKVLGVTGTARASFSFYNTLGEVEALVSGVKRTREMFA